MKLIEVYDGFLVAEIHWTEARHVVAALKGYRPEDTHQGLAVDSLATAFEAATYAGKLQLISGESEAMLLSRFHRDHGLSDDCDEDGFNGWGEGYVVARDRKERREARQAAASQPDAAD